MGYEKIAHGQMQIYVSYTMYLFENMYFCVWFTLNISFRHVLIYQIANILLEKQCYETGRVQNPVYSTCVRSHYTTTTSFINLTATKMMITHIFNHMHLKQYNLIVINTSQNVSASCWHSRRMCLALSPVSINST